MGSLCSFFFFQAEDGIRDLVRSRGLGDVYKRQGYSGYVVGKKQAWFHRGRWWLGRNVLMESAPELETAAKREIDRLLK